MRAHYLQHVPFEGIGRIDEWLATHGYTVTHTALYEKPLFPDCAELDLLIIMGGPMSVHDEGQYPWMKAEKAFIRRALQSGIPTLGICLGAQLIAHVLGARVYKNAVREIGWYPVLNVPAESDMHFMFPRKTMAFHWHGETFDLPKGAIWLARSEGCKYQAFQWGERAIALQFHVETTPASAQALIEQCGDEMAPGPFVQRAKDIIKVPKGHYAAIHELMDTLLLYLTE